MRLSSIKEMSLRLIFTCIFSFLLLHAKSQETNPVNGPHNPKPSCYAFVNATIFVDGNKKLTNATLVIRNGKIEKVGNGISIPSDAKTVNLNGMFIYPSFIDLYSDYGLKPVAKNKGNAQYQSNKNGAFAWNDAINAEVNAIDFFSYDEKKAKTLIESGFGSVLTGIQDGIMRGTATLVLTKQGLENENVLIAKASNGFSFNKGTSTQDYPNSLMGSIALIRQTLYDAQWYKAQLKEKNLTLEAINNNQNLPNVFETDNKLSVLRAAKIAKEFSKVFIVKGGGDEYQRLNEIKETQMALILPLNFPKPFDVSDAFDANYISTADLKHWELAPSNPAQLAKANINFAITSTGCTSAEEFFKNLRKAVFYGLPENVAINALTKIPAQLIKAENLVGTLEPNKMANFLICTNSIFDKESNITEHWINGVKHEINSQPQIKINGVYRLKLKNFENQTLIIEGAPNKTKGKLVGTDTLVAQEAFFQDNSLQVLFYQKNQTKLFKLILWPQNGSEQNLSGLASNENVINDNFTALYERASNSNSTNQKDTSKTTLELGKTIYPFTDYGWSEAPINETIVFKNATVWSNEKEGVLKETDVAISNGKIIALGKNLSIKNAKIVDASNKHLTNGIIDEHSHIAITQGVNECSQAITSETRVGDVVYSEDINIYRQLAGGVTSAQLLHGSCNPIGGQSAIIKLRWGQAPEKMKIADADGFIKFALGENVKQSNWGQQTHRYPQTRMGVEQLIYDAFIRAKLYEQNLKLNPLTTRKDLELDAIVEILTKKRFISCHSYVQSEINMLMHVGDSMGFKVNTFTHILEGYKVADKMKIHGANASTFADWWAYKYEVIDAIPHNAAIMQKAGINVAINSDDAEMGRRLNQEAAKIIKYGNITEEEAWKMVTLNPAKMLHLDSKLGSIAIGKDADLVLWSDNPLSIYAKPEMTFVDGICYYSLAQDQILRNEIKAERQRIINKMIGAKLAGEKTEKKISKIDENYHCED
jgi:imidazolonepropionase-like amidohydrolase